MTGFELAASLVSSVAWPLVVGILVVVLRAEIKSAAKAIIQRIADITEFKGAGVSVKLEKEIEAVVEKTQEITESVQKSPENVGGAKRRVKVPRQTDAERAKNYQRLAAQNPNAAVLGIFSELEGLLRQLHSEHYVTASPGQYVSVFKILKDFERDGVMPQEMIMALREMNEIRNKVAHADEKITTEGADAFIGAVANVLGWLILSDTLKRGDGQE